MAYMLELISAELKEIGGAAEFYQYLEPFVYREEKGDIYNGFGGFIRGSDNIMFNIDLRTIAPKNRTYFWRAAQEALMNLKVSNQDAGDGITALFIVLMDMHKRIERQEDPMLLNHLKRVEPVTFQRTGPGWENE